MDYRALNRELRAAQPMVIYQRVGGGYTGIAAHYAKHYGSQMIWHVAHDSDVTHANLEPARNPIRPHLEKQALKYGARNAHAIVTQTEHQAQLLQANFHRAADLVIPNFHPTPAEPTDKSGPMTVVWVANLRPWKRPEAFIQLAQRLSDLQGVQFVMIGAAPQGRGDAHWRDQLMQSIRATRNLDYRGAQSRKEVNALLAKAHLFVNTSECEGFPNTFIESWMREVPVISLSVNPDGVFDREMVGAHARTTQGLEGWVRKMLQDPELRLAHGAGARQYAMRNHSLVNAARLADFIVRRAQSSDLWRQQVGLRGAAC